MNVRQGLQLNLQSAVEGLSAETTTALAIPLVALGVWWFIRRIHLRLAGYPGNNARR